MEDPILVCPVCCNEKFTSKQSLVDHLSDIQCNINCPVCSIKCLSLENLINHLRDDNCVAFNIDETIISQRNLSSPVNSKHTVLNHNFESIKTDENRTQNGIFDSELPNHTDKSFVEPETYYVDLLSKQSKKSYLEDQHLKFPKMDGEGQYLIMTGNRVLLTSASAVVTKQNIDGTISLNTIKDMNLEPETDMTAVDNEMIENKEEIYSCNTCGVSFSSVTEHIQNYHNDQVVVVEGTDENTATTTSVELVNEEPTDRQPSRRMITDTGDIIETPVLDDEKIDVNNTKNIVVQITENISGKDVTHCVLFDEYNDQAITGTSKSEDYDTFHKNVVLKEMETETGNKIKVYYCETCHLYVTSLSQFKLQPCKKTKYVCPHCPMSYDKAKSLCAHMKVHKNQIGEKVSKPATFECEICSTVFPTSKSFKLHRRMHDPIKSRPIEVPVEMLGGVERTDDRFLCLVCDKLIPVYYRTIHQNSHKASGKMICDICNKKFESKDYLEMHMTVHNMDKAPVGKQDQSLPYDCLYCARKFARPHEKVKHERIHTGEKPHSCEICGKAFRVSYCLTLHMRTHTGARPYACPHCNKRFKAHSVFNHHLLTHSEVRAYKCPFCPKAFKTSVQLAGHKNSHTKPFACQQCNRPFASLYAVRVHMETHARTNSLKYACVQCGASYARAFALNDHMRQAHSEDTSLTNANDALTRLKEDKWITEEIVDADDLPALNKDLANDINELALNANELIVP